MTVREISSLARRQSILDEASRIISECGYHGFGIQELARRCGLSKAGLLHHFASKEQLLIAVLRNRDRRDEEVVANAIRAMIQNRTLGSLTREMVLGTFRATVERNSTQPELVRLYAMLRAEALNPGHPAHAYFNAREAAILDIYSQIVAPHVGNPRSVARQLLGLMVGLETQWLRENLAFDLVAEWDQAMARLLPEQP